MLYLHVCTMYVRPNICYYALGLEWPGFQEFGEAGGRGPAPDKVTPKNGRRASGWVMVARWRLPDFKIVCVWPFGLEGLQRGAQGLTQGFVTSLPESSTG